MSRHPTCLNCGGTFGQHDPDDPTACAEWWPSVDEPETYTCDTCGYVGPIGDMNGIQCVRCYDPRLTFVAGELDEAVKSHGGAS